MDVLVAIPTGRRLFEPAMRAAFQQKRDRAHRLDIVFVYEGDAPDADGRQRVTDKYNRARDIFLAGTWDAMLTIEGDMIIPLDALELLKQADADIAYGLYCFRRKPHEWNAYSVIHDMEAYSIDRVRPDMAKESWGKVIDVDGIGFGCTLIKRHVLEHIAFRIGEQTHGNGEKSHADWYFALDAIEAGYKQVCHLGVQCGHITEWNEAGEPGSCVLWPDITTESLHRFDTF